MASWSRDLRCGERDMVSQSQYMDRRCINLIQRGEHDMSSWSRELRCEEHDMVSRSQYLDWRSAFNSNQRARHDVVVSGPRMRRARYGVAVSIPGLEVR